MLRPPRHATPHAQPRILRPSPYRREVLNMRLSAVRFTVYPSDMRGHMETIGLTGLGLDYDGGVRVGPAPDRQGARRGLLALCSCSASGRLALARHRSPASKAGG